MFLSDAVDRFNQRCSEAMIIAKEMKEGAKGTDWKTQRAIECTADFYQETQWYFALQDLRRDLDKALAEIADQNERGLLRAQRHSRRLLELMQP